MRILQKEKLIFLANPRTGSGTVRQVLDPLSDIKSVHISEVDDDFPFYHHISALELMTIFAKKNWAWNDYRKFTFTRNPFDRVVSLYFHYRHHFDHKKSGAQLKDFGEFVFGLDVNNNRLQNSTRKFIAGEDGSDLDVDVLRFEEIESTLLNYLNSCGVNAQNIVLPHLHKSGHRNSYRSYYTSETRRFVEKIYADDIESFGYRF